MNEETNLPEGLQLAVKLIAQIGDDESDRAISAVHAACDLAQRVAELEAERDELRKELDAAQQELNCGEAEIEAALCALPEGAIPTDYECLGDYIRAVTRALIEERDELRARLAEIEAQEPICHREEPGNRVVMNTSGGPGKWRERQKYHGPLYASPVPAQAVPDGCGACGDGCAKRGSCRLADESPEHKA